MCFSAVPEYDRQHLFDYYRRFANPFYSMTFELEATRLKAFVDSHGYRTYLNLCYFFTRAAQSIEDFRYRWRDGKIVLYERLHPGLTVPAAGGSFSYAHLRFDGDVHGFNERAESRLPPPTAAPRLPVTEHENFLFFTAIPNTVFSGFTHAWASPLDGAPRVAFGSLIERDERLWTSVGVQVNHCFIDGRALGELARRAQEEFDFSGGDSPRARRPG
jgi:chloramphenicol O-acetyltransferase type A